MISKWLNGKGEFFYKDTVVEKLKTLFVNHEGEIQVEEFKKVVLANVQYR